MKLRKLILRTSVILAIAIMGSVFIYGQQAETSYQMTLQLISGSEESGPRADIPGELSGVMRQIKSQFGLSNYRLSNTFLGRITNVGGSFSYRSASNNFGKDPQGPLTFLDWSIGDFRSVPGAKNEMFTAENFTFGARIPVITGMNGSENKAAAIVNYEQVGITLRRLRFVENTPTLIGTLSLPGSSGTVFLVMTVKSAD